MASAPLPGTISRRRRTFDHRLQHFGRSIGLQFPRLASQNIAICIKNNFIFIYFYLKRTFLQLVTVLATVSVRAKAFGAIVRIQIAAVLAFVLIALAQI